jgi:hypothetical protein
MTGRVSPGLLATMRRQSERSFTHTYTRTPRIPVADNPLTPDVDESVDAWNQPVTTLGAPVTGNICVYIPRPQAFVSGRGLMVSDKPIMLIAAIDPLAAGDLVSNVVDSASGTLLLLGPVTVESVDPNPDAPIYRVATFRVVTPV